MTEVRDAGPFERIMTLTIDEAALEDAKVRTARKLAGELKIKGFRPGKAPRNLSLGTSPPRMMRSEPSSLTAARKYFAKGVSSNVFALGSATCRIRPVLCPDIGCVSACGGIEPSI